MDHTHVCTRKWWTLFQSSTFANESFWFSAIIFISTSSDVLFQDCFEILKTHLQEWCFCERVVWCGISGWGLLFCSSVRLYGANFAQVLPFSKSSRIVSPVLSRFTCIWFSINFWVIQGSVAFCKCSYSVCIRRSHIPCFTRKALLWDETPRA